MNIFYLALLALCTLVVTPISTQAQEWEYYESKDKLTGKVSSRVIFTPSYNRIQGTFTKDFVSLILTCDKELALMTSHISLEGDIDCTSYGGCTATQIMRFKFDNIEEPLNVTAYLPEHRNGAFFKHKKLIDLMKKAVEVRIEFEPMFTKGSKVIADFGLVGFSKALEKCN